MNEKLLPPMTDEFTVIGEHFASEDNATTEANSEKRQNGRTRINAVLREYVVTLQHLAWDDVYAIVRTVAKPKLNFIRGKGWFLLCPETQQSRYIGASADEAVCNIYNRIVVLRQHIEGQQ